MVRGYNSLYNDYEKLLIKNDKLSKENRDLKYFKNLLEKQNNALIEREKKAKEELLQNKNLIKEKDFEIARLKALLNMDGTNHNIPTSQTPIHKKKVIPNSRQKTNLPKGGQIGHLKHKLHKFNDDEITQQINHEMFNCPCCNSNKIQMN